jgi:regulatory protein
MTSGQLRKITDIQVQKKRRDRVAIFLDGEFAFGLHQDVLLAAGIATGDELTPAQIESIQQLEARRSGKEKAIRLLAHRARSRKEIVDRLKQAGYAPQDIDWVIEELQRLKLLDDAEFARLYARTRMITKPVGAFLMRQELKQRGLADKEIENAVAVGYEEQSEREVARELAAKNKKKQVRLDEDKAKQRVADFLLRRGFHWDIVNEIIEDWDNLEP